MSVKNLNPIAKVKLSVAQGVRKNSGVLQFRTKEHNLLTGDTLESVIEADVWLYDVDRANDWLVSKGVYQASDIRASIPALCLYDAYDMISNAREWNMLFGGIDVTTDTVLWHGALLRIVKVEAQNFWNNHPASYRVSLRSTQPDVD